MASSSDSRLAANVLGSQPEGERVAEGPDPSVSWTKGGRLPLLKASGDTDSPLETA